MSMPTCDTCSHVRLLCEKAGAVSQTTGCSFHEYKGNHYKLSDDELDLLVKILKIGAAIYDDKDVCIFKYDHSTESVFASMTRTLSEQYGFDEYLVY